jgi:LPXTG-site transpeptidase (sortase) family protein
VAIKVYKKQQVKFKKRTLHEPYEPKYIKIEEKGSKPLTLWDVFAGMKNDFIHLLQTSTMARILIPTLLIGAGGIILFRQLYPEVKQRARQVTGYYDPTRAELVKGDSVQQKEVYLSNPGADYFKKLTNEAMGENILQTDAVSSKYHGRFNLSIPSLGLNNLPVQANVDSGVESVYRSVLNSGLAHFKGTSLPMSETSNNSVIYGHSAGGDYYSRTKDVAAAFTKLNDIKIGDEIIVNMDGKEYRYRVVKTKIVQPDDSSIINGTKGKKTLTLLTCFPAGNNSQRFVAVARPE